MLKARLLSAVCGASLAFGVPALTAFAAEAAGAAGRQDASSQALEVLGLENNPAVSWDSRDMEAGAHRFTNVRHEGPEGAVFSAATLVIDNPRMGEDGPIFDAARFSDLTLQADPAGAPILVEEAVITAPSPALAQALSTASTEEGAEAASQDIFQQPAGEMLISGLRIRTPADPETGTGEGAVAIERIFLTDGDGDGLADMGLTNLSMQLAAPGAPPTRISLESAQASEVLLEASGNGFNPAAFDPALLAQKSYDRLGVTNLVIEAGGVRLSMPALTSEMSALPDGALRTTADMPSFQVSVEPDADEQSAQVAAGLAMLGYEDLDLSYTASYVYEPETDRLYTDGPNALTLRDGGTFDIRYDMTGVTDYVQSAVELEAETAGGQDPGSGVEIGEAEAMELLSSMQLGGLSLSFEDAGLLERGLTLFATQSGVDVATARAQAVGMVALVSMGAGEALPPAVVAQMSQALTAFIQNGGRVEVGLQPEQPMGFMDMMTEEGGFDAEAAGLSFAHEAP